MGSKRKVPITEEVIRHSELDNSISLRADKMPRAGSSLEIKVEKLAKFVNAKNAYPPAQRNRKLDRPALRNILTNLILADEKDKYLAYTRNQNTYSEVKQDYGLEYFTYERYIRIIDGLIQAGLVLNFEGFYEAKTGEGRKSRMRLTEVCQEVLEEEDKAFRPLDIDYYYVSDIGNVRYVVDNSLIRTNTKFPLIAVVIRSDSFISSKGKRRKGKPLEVKVNTEVKRMLRNIQEYNKFIESVSVIVPEKATEVKATSDDGSSYNSDVQVTAINSSDRAPLPFEAKVTHDIMLRAFRSMTAFSFPQDEYVDHLVEGKSLSYPVVYNSEEQTRYPLYSLKTSTSSSLSEEKTETEQNKGEGEEEKEKRVKTITKRTSQKFRYSKPLQCKLYRIFNRRSLKFGGRFYGGGYQSIKKGKRKKLLINGKPVIEADYSAFHTRMLYHIEGLDYPEDPYSLYGADDNLRAAVKSMLNKSISATTRKGALSAFVKEVYYDEPIENQLIIDALDKQNLRPVNIYDKICESHPKIYDYLGSDWGVRLQRIDSDLAEKILMYFTRKQVPCLCVHDSFIVPKTYGDELKRVMMDFYFERFKFYPVVVFKKLITPHQTVNNLNTD